MSLLRNKLFGENIQNISDKDLTVEDLDNYIVELINNKKPGLTLHMGSLEHVLSYAKIIKNIPDSEIIYTRNFYPNIDEWTNPKYSHLINQGVPRKAEYARIQIKKLGFENIITVLEGNLRVTSELLNLRDIKPDVIIYDTDHKLINPELFLSRDNLEQIIIQKFPEHYSLKDIRQSRVFDSDLYSNLYLQDYYLIVSKYAKAVHYNSIKENKKELETIIKEQTSYNIGKSSTKSKPKEEAKHKTDKKTINKKIKYDVVSKVTPPEMPSKEEQEEMIDHGKRNAMRHRLKERMANKRKQSG